MSTETKKNTWKLIIQLITPSVVAIAVAIDTISWIISFQVFFFVSVLIRKINFLLNINFLEVRGEGWGVRYLINVHDPPVVLCVHDPIVVLCVHDPIVVLCVHDPPVGADPCVRPMSERHISADFAFAFSLPFPSFASTSFADSVRPTVVGRTHGSAPTGGGVLRIR